MINKTYILTYFVVLFTTAICAQNKTDSKGLKQGAWKKTDNKGKIIYEGNFVNDKPTGTFKYYFGSDTLQAIMIYSNNGSVAHSTSYYGPGKKKSEGKYVNEKRDSTWIIYNYEGQIASIDNYVMGQKHGKCLVNYPNGKIAFDQTWVNGKEEGPWIEYFENGNMKIKKNYVAGSLEGKVFFYRSNGSLEIEANYKNDLSHGNWGYYNENGTLNRVEEYQYGKMQRVINKNGTFTEYYLNQAPKSIYVYKNGKREGEFKEFYDSAKWVKNIRPAKESEFGYFPEETVEELVGIQPRVSGNYFNDQLQGKVTYYKADGKVDYVETYDKGQLIETTKK